jgi:selenocysteine lyase/cysteine desulfurase
MIARAAAGAGRPGGAVGEETARYREHFSGFGGKSYVDCAAQGPFPRETVEEIRRALRIQEHPEELSETLFEELPDRARRAVARLVGCNPASIALGSGASHGINVAARGLPLRSGDEVVLARGEFPANLLPWLNLEPDGVRVRLVEPADGRHVRAEQLVGAIGPRTRVLSVSMVAFATGYRADLQALGEACRERDLFFVVDGAQGVGAVDFRVADHPIDVLAVSGYKWLFGPYGTGFTYVNPRILDRLRVIEVNWLGVEGANQFNRRREERLQFREGARRFDIPETASFLNLSAFAASVEFLLKVKVTTVESHVRRLIDLLLRRIGATRLRVVSDLDAARRSTILALEGPTLDDTRRIYRGIRQKGVVVSLRDNLIRVSPNIYNTPEDIERLVAAAAG